MLNYQTGQGYFDVNVMTYNISWEAMEGKRIKNIDLGPICLKQQENICLNNIAQFIIHFDNLLSFDFIGLQEASKWENIYQKIRAQIPHLQPINHGLSREQQVVFFDSRKYQPQNGVWAIKSYLADPGRPFMIIFLRNILTDNNICIINMHPGHQRDFLRFEEHLKETLKGNKPNSVYLMEFNIVEQFPAPHEITTQILTKLHTNNIIMMGDMNFNPSSPYVFLPSLLDGGRSRILHGVSNSYTCCDSQLQGNANKAYDHILSSSSQIHHYVTPIQNASDHLPVIAQINLEIC